MFKLHPQLAADTLEVISLSLSKVLLMNNATLPWVILVPQREGIREWYELEPRDQRELHAESMRLSAGLMREFNGDKLNTGALGNLVPQLHLHHVVRYESDPVWPSPVWGKLEAQPYTQEQAQSRLDQIRHLISI